MNKDPKHISEIIPDALTQDQKIKIENFGENKAFYCRKEVNKWIRCNSQCKACENIDNDR